MTSRIIVAIVAVFAAVLSLAAPVAVDAQVSFTLTDRSFGHTQATATGLTPGQEYYVHWCAGSQPTWLSCTQGPVHNREGWLQGFCTPLGTAGASGTLAYTYRGGWGPPSSSDARPNRAWVLFADPPTLDSPDDPNDESYSWIHCRNPVPGAIVSVPDLRGQAPILIARDVTETSATLALEGPYSSHKMDRWAYVVYWDSDRGLYPMSEQTCTLGAAPTPEIYDPEILGTPNPHLSDLLPGTTYAVRLYGRGTYLDGIGAPVPPNPKGLECSLELTRIFHPPGERFGIRFTTKGVSVPAPAAPAGVEATTDGSGSVTLSWEHPGESDDPVKEPARYEYRLRRGGQGVGDWTTVPGSNADTTSVTIDLTTGAVVAVNNATPPMVEWTIYLRARNADGTPGRYTETVVTAGPETVVPALPLAGLVTLALMLFLGGQRQRQRGG